MIMFKELLQKILLSPKRIAVSVENEREAELQTVSSDMCLSYQNSSYAKRGMYLAFYIVYGYSILLQVFYKNVISSKVNIK